MKRIGIDARLIAQTGVGTYVRNLIYHLDKLQPSDLHFVLFYRPEDTNVLPKVNTQLFSSVQTKSKWHSVAEQTHFLSALIRQRLDLMHFTYFSYPVCYRRPFVATVHDLTPLLFRTGRASTKNNFAYAIKHAAFRYVLSSQVHNAQHILTPTRAVASQLTKKFGIQLNRITPLYEGVDFILKNTSPPKKSTFSQYKPFILYVGNFYPHKNIPRLIEAMGMLKSKNTIKLVLVGPQDFFASRIARLAKTMGVSQRVVFIKNPSTTTLADAYTHAVALIHPTLSEGFGLPLVEALHFKLPILASDIPVVRELLADACTYFDPYDCQAIAAAIETLDGSKIDVSHTSLLAKYSFSKMAESTMKIYRRFA